MNVGLDVRQGYLHKIYEFDMLSNELPTRSQFECNFLRSLHIVSRAED